MSNHSNNRNQYRSQYRNFGYSDFDGQFMPGHRKRIQSNGSFGVIIVVIIAIAVIVGLLYAAVTNLIYMPI